MKSRRLICCPQSEDCTLPHSDRKCRVVHHSKFGCLMTVVGQSRRTTMFAMSGLAPIAAVTTVGRKVPCRARAPASAQHPSRSAAPERRGTPPHPYTPRLGGAHLARTKQTYRGLAAVP